MADKSVILFTGPGCRLCDEAEQMLFKAGLSIPQIDKIDVTTSLELKKIYGLKIPVLRKPDSDETLFWPFDMLELLSYLGIETET